jgi:CCR4-NOT transcription complex subunit 7/8
MYHTSAIDLLQQSGMDFNRSNTDGINVFDFTQLLYTSGLVMNRDVYYITFHGSSDFGYLVKMLTCKALPSEMRDFFKVLEVLFPHFYDLKFLAEGIDQISSGGLQSMANELNVLRVGPQHQAGSDALVTLKTFTALKSRFFEGTDRLNELENKLYGLSERPGYQAPF